MDSPTHRQAGDGKDDDGDDLGEQVRYHSTGEDGGTRDWKRSESIDETGGHVGRDADRGALRRSDECHPEHPADEVLVVIPATGDLNGRAEDIDEEQHEDDRLDGDVEELRGLSDDAVDTATDQHEGISERPPCS